MAQASLSPDVVSAILDDLATPEPPTYRALAAKYDVSIGTISRLKNTNAALAAETAPAPLATAPRISIHPSPLNPRKRFDEEALADLAESVRAEGVLLPLLVRLVNQPGNRTVEGATEGDLEIIAGERRWRAAQIAELDTLPIRLIDPCPDLKLLQLALTENVARQDMTALEEAEAIAAMQALGASASQAADTLGMNKRTAQKRLRLIADTTPAVRAALEAGSLSTEHANVLAAYCPTSRQDETLAEIAQGRIRTAADLKAMILHTRIPVSGALFDLSTYVGEIITDDETGTQYFADAEAFRAAQTAALPIRAAALRARYDWVTVIDEGKSETYRRWQYSTRQGHPKAGCVIVLDARMVATIHSDLVLDSVLQAESKPIGSTRPEAAPQPAEPVTKPHCSHAHKRKTEALQAAIAASSTTAIRLVIMSLLGAHEAVRIKPEWHPPADDRCTAPAVVAALESYIPALQSASGGTLAVSVQGWLTSRIGSYADYPATWDQAALWDTLADLSDSAALGLMSALVALRCGSFDGHTPAMGDRPAAQAIADHLGLCGNESLHGLTLRADDLEGLRKDTLLTIARTLGTHDAAKLKTADLKAQILDDADPAYVLPTLRFGREEAIRQALSGVRLHISTPALIPDPDEVPDEYDDGADLDDDSPDPEDSLGRPGIDQTMARRLTAYADSVRYVQPASRGDIYTRLRTAMQEHACDEIGEHAESWLDAVTSEQASELHAAICGAVTVWAMAHDHMPDFYEVIDTSEHIAPGTDDTTKIAGA